MNTRTDYALRPARIQDAEQLLDWRNDPLARTMSRNSEVIPLEEHREWLRSALRNEGCRQYICLWKGRAVGGIRFDRREPGVWEMNIMLAAEARGQGHATEFGRMALAELMGQAPLKRVLAWVKTENIPSLRLFRKLGFKEEIFEGPLHSFVFSPQNASPSVAGSQSRVLIAVPAHNEEVSLPGFLGELSLTGYDILVINDASNDRTEEIARVAGARVLSLPVNLGIGGGMQAAFLYGMRNGYDIVVQMDGDGQHNPARVSSLLEPILQDRADCAIGSRYLPSSPDKNYVTPIARRLGMKFSTCCLFLTSGLTIHDTTSGFRALNRKAFTFFALHYPTDHPEAEALLLLHRAGLRIEEVPTRMRQRVSGHSLFTFFTSALYPLRLLLGLLSVLTSRR